jgi:transcriptional regulator with XRE-family HTH domain
MSATPRSARDTPDTQRRRLRDALRKARTDRGLTQGAVAERLYWSLSKVIRIETGTVPVVPTDVQALARLYELDEAMTEQLIILSRGARKQGWSEYKDVYGPGALTYFGNESAARTIYVYEPIFIHGLLQTPDYARAIFNTANALSNVDRKLEVRLQRQQLLDSKNPPQISIIQDEATLCRSVGGRETMLKQIEHIKRMSRRGNVSIQILPFRAGEYQNMGESFTLLLFDDAGLPDMLFREDAVSASSGADDAQLVTRYLSDWADLQARATPADDLVDELDRISQERFCL